MDRTFYSSEGCTGQVAQYDLYLTNDRTLYDGNVRSDEVIQCDEAGKSIIVLLLLVVLLVPKLCFTLFAS